ncbi:MAG: hypothetical protein ACYTBP_02415, partial [Planctomycetota bacterium]
MKRNQFSKIAKSMCTIIALVIILNLAGCERLVRIEENQEVLRVAIEESANEIGEVQRQQEQLQENVENTAQRIANNEVVTEQDQIKLRRKVDDGRAETQKAAKDL